MSLGIPSPGDVALDITVHIQYVDQETGTTEFEDTLTNALKEIASSFFVAKDGDSIDIRIERTVPTPPPTTVELRTIDADGFVTNHFAGAKETP